MHLVVKAAGDGPVEVDEALVVKVVQTLSARYDKAGDQHYDIVSAFIKSLRGSDPNAAITALVVVPNP